MKRSGFSIFGLLVILGVLLLLLGMAFYFLGARSERAKTPPAIKAIVPDKQ